MKQIDISKKFKKSPMAISFIVRGIKCTPDHELARAVSQISGKAPIEHISARHRATYLKAYPDLAASPTQSG